ncbi:hypothetical protein EZS27_009809 [termite gut metagenome]|uniref:Uncharacterized protein n=1 Tax=termite gut metagenome TaxID=433724 RepID=A0A5J4SAU7_9ZZZZ
MKEADKDNHKGGRPKAGIARQKKRIVSIRFSEPEYYAVKHRASLAGLTLSDYSRSAILEGKVIEPVKKEEMDVLRKLSGEANNLNQLAHQANIYGMFYLEKEARNVLETMSEIINQLSDDWKNNKRKKL